MESSNGASERMNEGAPKMQSSSSGPSKNHRRVQSDEQLGASASASDRNNNNSSSSEYGIPPAPFPTQISYASPNHNGMNTPTSNTAPNMDSQASYDSHTRSQSWAMGGNGLQYPPYPTMGFQPSQGMQFPTQQPPNLSPMYVGSPYNQTMMDPSQMAAFQQQMDPNLAMRYQNPPSFFQQQPQQALHNQHRGHKRAHSFSGAPSYGSMDAPSAPVPPPRHKRSGSSSSQRDFSPRHEIMGLAGRRPSIDSSSVGGGSFHAPPSPGGSIKQAGSFTLPSNDLRTPYSGSNNGFINGGGSTDGAGSGGEAVFLAKKPKGRSHMRQQSAQLYMENVKGQEQIPACRDILFLMLFVFHLLGIIYLGNKYGYEAERYHNGTDGDVTIFYSNILYLVCLCGAVAVAISACTLFLFMAIAKRIVQVALFVAITLSFAWGTIGVGFSPSILVPAIGFVALLLTVAYTFIVWDRIPFVAANLDTALNGIRANLGLLLVAFFFQALGLLWSVYFVFVLVGVYDSILVGDITFESVNMDKAKIAIYSGLGLSYYWTIHVLMNIVQATVSALIGKWWYTRDGDTSSQCSDLSSSAFRSMFYGIGSICYGSLFVGPARMLHQLSAFFRPNGGGSSSLLCLHECLFCIQSCLTSCVDNFSDRYSPWSFTYIGLYGYGLVDAGQNAADLFEKRGWTTIVSDDLAANVLFMTSLVIGGVTGLFADLIEGTETLTLSTMGKPGLVSFGLGFAVGLVASSLLFGVITSAVNSVIVCFAASPVDFEQNHPTLSREMRSAWREVWPGCMDVVDMRVAVASYLDPAMSERNPEQAPLMP
ncbi:unnamed protein product [Cylindrotheca closterium]|uniref:Protein PNS1 n=1 Tax=Cylindrotheca closterium TaxID=2856 RepID=A0AAD2G7U0_9STRA|nr:unnamed protein product [Cylindrotheca closterium]